MGGGQILDDPIPEKQQFTEGNAVAVANDELTMVLGDDGVARSLDNGEIVVLGIEDRETRAEISGVEYPAHEIPVAVVQWSMPRVLIPEEMAGEFADAETRPLALFTLERPMTQEESEKMWVSNLEINGGFGSLDEATTYLLLGGATLLVVLIVVSLVTAVSAAEVDEEVRTIVAVGAPGSIRRHFLGPAHSGLGPLGSGDPAPSRHLGVFWPRSFHTTALPLYLVIPRTP